MKAYDIVIVGNGISGLAIVFALKNTDNKLQIAIVGPEELNFAASKAAGAMLNVFAEVTTTTLATPTGRHKFEIGMQASQLWPAWLDAIASQSSKKSHPLKLVRGTYVLLNTSADAMDDNNYQMMLDAVHQYKQPNQEVPTTTIQGLKPSPRHRPLKSLFLPEEHAIDSAAVLHNLTDILQKTKEVTFINDTVLEIDQTKTKLFELKLKNTTIFANQVVLATGAQLNPLLDKFPQMKNRIPKVFSGAGTAFTMKPSQPHAIKHVIRTVNRGMACGMHLVPRGELLYIGATNFITPDPSLASTITSSLILLQSAIEQFNTDFATANIMQWHFGYRPIAIDTFPIIGKTSIPGFWIFSGGYRDGLHNAPVYATELAKEILGGKSKCLAPFKPERKAIFIMPRNQTIDAAAKHYMSAAYQHDLEFPKMSGWQEMSEQMIMQKLNDTYDLLGDDYGIPPEILVVYSRCSQQFLKDIRKHYQALCKNG